MTIKLLASILIDEARFDGIKKSYLAPRRLWLDKKLCS